MNPEYPLYIVSKGRYDTRMTVKALEYMQVPYHIIIEEQEYLQYSSVIDKSKILVLDKTYQQRYDTCDNYGLEKSTGPGPARNFAWDHSISNGFKWHWVMDDNIRRFCRFNDNKIFTAGDGTIFRCMEIFCERYRNIAMAGPQYFMFIVRKTKRKPISLNTRIYSCNLIRNDTPYRWRGRYNEDTDLSLRMLKDNWCTVEFNAFLQEKIATQKVQGGNTKDFYAVEGTLPKSEMLVKLHPDVSKIKWKFNRWHHYVDYSPFKKNQLVFNPDKVPTPGVENFKMKLVARKSNEKRISAQADYAKAG